MSFEGKVALITGAGTGMGAATAKLLVERGARVGLVGLIKDDVASVRKEIEGAGGEAIDIAADVSSPEQMREAVGAVVKAFGALHYGVNCAGVGAAAIELGELEPEDWHKVTKVNLDGIFYAMRYEIPAILAAGGGAIVNVSSVYAHRGFAGRASYSASKHGTWGLTRSAALDYAAKGLRINALAPGIIDTPMLGIDREHSAKVAEATPIKRLGLPREIATAVAFLLSDEASYVCGAELLVDGGFLA